MYHQLAAKIQRFQRGAAKRGGAPIPIRFLGQVQFLRAQAAALVHKLQNIGNQRLHRLAGARVLLKAPPHKRHAGPILGEHQAHIFIKGVYEHAAAI